MAYILFIMRCENKIAFVGQKLNLASQSTTSKPIKHDSNIAKKGYLPHAL